MARFHEGFRGIALSSSKLMRRVVFAALVGATVEWYDFFLYGVVAGIVFNKLYFPAGDPAIATLLAYSTFAVGFVTRPLGGMIFGHFGDRIGRKTMLVLTLMIMGWATFLIALVPTYAQIGVWAPLLLLALRVLQGIGLGGEWGGAVLMTFEYAPVGQRGLYASLPQIGLSIGLALASGVVALLSFTLTNDQFLAWGWRVAFALSFALVLIGVYVRLNILETPEFTAVREGGRRVAAPFLTLLSEYPREILAGMGARYIDGVFFNVFAVFSISYLTQQLSVPRTQALLVGLGGGGADVRVHPGLRRAVGPDRAHAHLRLGLGRNRRLSPFPLSRPGWRFPATPLMSRWR